MIGSIEFQTSSNESFKCGENGDAAMYNISVPGKKLAFISGSNGLAIDSLVFYYL